MQILCNITPYETRLVYQPDKLYNVVYSILLTSIPNLLLVLNIFAIKKETPLHRKTFISIFFSSLNFYVY